MTRYWTPFAARAALAFAATSLGILALAPAEAQTPAGSTPAANKAAVQASFDAWAAGTGSPFAASQSRL